MSDAPKENLSQILRRQRKVHKFSVEQLSALLKEHDINVAPKTIYNWETGQSKPALDVLFALMDIYGVPTLLDGLKNESPKIAYLNNKDDFVFIPKAGQTKEKPPWGKLETEEEAQRFLEAVMKLPESARADIALMVEFVVFKSSY